MAAGRESFSVVVCWKYPRTSYKNSNKKRNIFLCRLESVYILFKNVLKYKRDRKMFIEDNFNRPYNKQFKCKLQKVHRYIIDYDCSEPTYFCIYCGKRMKQSDYELDIRNKKIMKLRKR